MPHSTKKTAANDLVAFLHQCNPTSIVGGWDFQTPTFIKMLILEYVINNVCILVGGIF